MLTKFIYNQANEAQRLLFIYHSVAFDKYCDYGYMVLPYRTPGHPKSVYLPKIKGLDQTEIVHILSKYPILSLPTSDPILCKLSEKVKEKMGKVEIIDYDKTRRVEKDWKKLEIIFDQYFFNLFPQYRLNKLKLKIYWTRFGSLVSYNEIKSRGILKEASIFLRDDMGMAQIVEGVLSSLLTEKFNRREMSWLQYETLIDFFCMNTCFSHIAPNFYPTVLMNDQKNNFNEGKLLNDSINYLESLGLERHELISIKKGVIYIKGKPSKVPFGKTETKFLEVLIRKPLDPVSYYDLGDILWSDNPDLFSLWALSQLAYKVRNKLKKNEINPDVIVNSRGNGYMFIPNN